MSTTYGIDLCATCKYYDRCGENNRPCEKGEYEPQFVACYKCKVKIPNTGAPVCAKCFDDNLKIAAAGWKDADKLTIETKAC